MGPPALVKLMAPLPILAGSHAIPAVPMLLSLSQDTAPHPSPQQHASWSGSSHPSSFSIVRGRIPQHHPGWLGAGSPSPPPVPAGPTPPLPATAPHASTHCSTETLQNPNNSLFSTSNFLFFCVCMGGGGHKAPCHQHSPPGTDRNQLLQEAEIPSPPGRGEYTTPGAGIPQGWGQGVSGISHCHGCHQVPAQPETEWETASHRCLSWPRQTKRHQVLTHVPRPRQGKGNPEMLAQLRCH